MATKTPKAWTDLLGRVRACELCRDQLPHSPRPVLSAHPDARILVVGQAPGARVHESGVPWDDPSGARLREWMALSRDAFYDPRRVALMPMGFCYPGRGRSGDLPPRPECAETWHDPLLAGLKDVKLTLLIGQYAQAHYLGDRRAGSLTETVADWKRHRPRYVPLPHPSPRNNIWLAKHPWFDAQVVPYLRRRVTQVLRALG